MAAPVQPIGKPFRPTVGDIERDVEDRRYAEIVTFGTHLETARVLLRRHPELVTADEFPEPYRSVITRGSDAIRNSKGRAAMETTT